MVFHKESSCLVVKVSGDLDLSTAPRFKESIDQEMRKTGVPNLVLNLRGLNFVDSTGMGAILGREKEVSSCGGKMILTEVPPKIISMFEMAGLTGILSIVKREEEAIKLVSGENMLGERR